jgi:hypothetical protein
MGEQSIQASLLVWYALLLEELQGRGTPFFESLATYDIQLVAPAGMMASLPHARMYIVIGDIYTLAHILML